jgi:hypothetical protein
MLHRSSQVGRVTREEAFVKDVIRQARERGWRILPSDVIQDRDPGDEHDERASWSDAPVRVVRSASAAGWCVAEVCK